MSENTLFVGAIAQILPDTLTWLQVQHCGLEVLVGRRGFQRCLRKYNWEYSTLYRSLHPMKGAVTQMIRICGQDIDSCEPWASAQKATHELSCAALQGGDSRGYLAASALFELASAFYLRPGGTGPGWSTAPHPKPKGIPDTHGPYWTLVHMFRQAAWADVATRHSKRADFWNSVDAASVRYVPIYRELMRKALSERTQ